jgi:hypothetical protein
MGTPGLDLRLKEWELLCQPELGACILDACAEGTQLRDQKKKQASKTPRLFRREASTGGQGCPASNAAEKDQ